MPVTSVAGLELQATSAYFTFLFSLCLGISLAVLHFCLWVVGYVSPTLP